MNNLRTKLIAASIIMVAFAAGFYKWSTAAKDNLNGLVLAISTGSGPITLGQPLELRFELSNPTTGKIAVAEPSEMTGNLQLMISADGVNFRGYRGPGWGRRTVKRRETALAPGESIAVETNVMFNARPKTGHLTELYAERFKRDIVDSDFAFAEPGRYWIKAAYDDRGAKIESSPIYLEAVEPVGVDAEVWAAVKNDAAFAYLLHTGDIPYRPESPKYARFVETTRSISEQFPESALASSIQRKLSDRIAPNAAIQP